jgi:hypothetical protein
VEGSRRRSSHGELLVSAGFAEENTIPGNLFKPAAESAASLNWPGHSTAPRIAPAVWAHYLGLNLKQ